MEQSELLREAHERSVGLLRKLRTEKGFVASTTDVDNYKRVFSRDGVVMGLAALTTEDIGLIEGFRDTLTTLRTFQDETGRIPSNVSLDGSHVSYGMTVGRIDATLWYVIGAARYYLDTGDETFWNETADSIERALFYLSCLELNGRGLLYIPPGGDWADEYINEGYVLFDEALYALALYYYHKVTGDPRSSEKYNHLLSLVRVNYFPAIENAESGFVYHTASFDQACAVYEPPLPLSCFSPAGVVLVKDLFALALLLNLPVKTAAENEVMELEYERLAKDNERFPILPAFFPVIDASHPRWNDLRNNHRYRFKNKPHEFHNGGRWPMVHGWYLASKTELTLDRVAAFARVLQHDGYTFSEYNHGKTHAPSGTPELGFSASGYLMAYHRLVSGEKPFGIM